MRVTHFFTRYPHPYQPYNVLLVDRQKQAGLECATFSLYGSHRPRRSSRLEKFKYLLKGIALLPLARQFAKQSEQPVLQSLIVVGKMTPLIRSRPQVVHVHQIQILSQDVLTLFEILALRWIVSLRGSDIAVKPVVDPGERNFVKNALTCSHAIHAVSRSLKELAVAMGIDERKITVIRRAPDHFKPITRTVSFDDPVIHVSLIGRYHWSKGMVYAVQAIGHLVKLGRKIVLHLVGEGDKEAESELKYWAALLGCGEAVQFHGYLNSEQIDRLLAGTHIYIQPSISEGIPNTLVRAVNYRIPVVASDVGGIPEVMDDDYGILVPPGDVKSLAEAIDRIITDRSFRENLYAKPMAVNYDASSEMEGYRQLYERVLK